MQSLLQLNTQLKVPVTRLSILYSRAKLKSDAQTALRVNQNGKFKIVQISDAHIITGIKVCKDAINAYGNHLPEGKTNPLTINFIEKILNVEKLDLIILTKDQLHYNISNSQSALFKIVTPIIKHSIPFAAIFSNYNSKGIHTLLCK
jgi:predicted MPP superfamily phosphohydrolase